MCKVYADEGGINKLYHVCPPVRKIIHSLKLVDYLHVQADKPCYNYYIKLNVLINLYITSWSAFFTVIEADVVGDRQPVTSSSERES